MNNEGGNNTVSKEELLRLRQEVVSHAERLALEGNGLPEDRLRILIDIMSTSRVSRQTIQKATEIADLLDDDNQKLSAYMDIIYGIDQGLARFDAQEDVSQNSSEADDISNHEAEVTG